VFTSRWPVVISVFATCDVLLSGGMLLLFAVPMHVHSAEMTKSVSETQWASANLRRVIRFNLVVSTVVIAMGLVSLTSLTVGLSVGATPAVQIWVVWGCTVELVLSTLATHTVSHAWLPPSVRAAVTRCGRRWGFMHHGSAAPSATAVKAVPSSVASAHRVAPPPPSPAHRAASERASSAAADVPRADVRSRADVD